ncbi:MAG: DegV family protein [Anaerolineaceae bacterium]|nr:DegV family protein [Anaerolineaceae bacterium]MBN2678158.1 DegV family protein [Anaerolineaceae bacterium]
MTKVKIITDSSAYLPQKYIDQYGITVLPLYLIWDGKSYRDGFDIQASEYYTRQINATTLSTTSQVTVNDFKGAYQKLLDEGNDILVLPLSKAISGTYDSALQALEDFKGKPIELIDTKLVSMALSFMVLTAARAVEKGASLKECRQAALDAYPKIGVYFTVETLKYLAAGGRIGGAKKLLGTALDIKPVLAIIDGKIEPVASVRTKRKAMDKMIDLIEKDAAGRKPVRVSVFHANVPEEAAKLLEKAATRLGAEESILSEVSPAIGSHTGPGTISIAYMAG